MKETDFNYIAGDEGYLLMEVAAEWVRNKVTSYITTKDAGKLSSNNIVGIR